ncbi:hypothetical protein I5M32_15180 [Pedobacter sp. SD-b]|uniref:Uncharacterized protein n=1 Tax=Pedobacter segetis TaxID=2793069 RepID=A0ABS1BPN1_9SPHI|nr:hypothetical protein [Pedobacter segetis]MBK0384309.1 hypothetical protein [Pedobacter segetis]
MINNLGVLIPKKNWNQPGFPLNLFSVLSLDSLFDFAQSEKALDDRKKLARITGGDTAAILNRKQPSKLLSLLKDFLILISKNISYKTLIISII